MSEKEIIYGQVVSKANNYMAVPGNNGEKRIIKSAEVRNYEKSFLRQCKVYRNRLISRPFKFVVDVFESSMRYDLDNALKTLLDCLQYARAITDDNKCRQILATKHIDPKNPRVVFSIEEYEPRLFY